MSTKALREWLRHTRPTRPEDLVPWELARAELEVIEKAAVEFRRYVLDPKAVSTMCWTWVADTAEQVQGE